MLRLPRTKDKILDEAELENEFVPTTYLEEMIPLFLEVFIDIRDNLEAVYKDENTTT